MSTTRKRGRPSKYASSEEREAAKLERQRNRREAARATGHNASIAESYFARLSSISDPPIAHLTGTAAPSVTHELEELLPPLSPVPAPLELEDHYVPIDELPLELNYHEAVARPNPEPPVRQSRPTSSEQPHDNPSNLETRVHTLPTTEPREDICTLAHALADQLH